MVTPEMQNKSQRLEKRGYQPIGRRSNVKTDDFDQMEGDDLDEDIDEDQPHSVKKDRFESHMSTRADLKAKNQGSPKPKLSKDNHKTPV